MSSAVLSDEILKKAQSEKPDKLGDEREKMIYDKSFYWAFLGMSVLATVFAVVRNIHDQDPYDIMALMMFAGASAFAYRFIKSRKGMDLFCGILMLGLSIIATVQFFASFKG